MDSNENNRQAGQVSEAKSKKLTEAELKEFTEAVLSIKNALKRNIGNIGLLVRCCDPRDSSPNPIDKLFLLVPSSLFATNDEIENTFVTRGDKEFHLQPPRIPFQTNFVLIEVVNSHEHPTFGVSYSWK
jgi:hypothetical protein